MNKQEAIKELESYKMIGTDARSACYNEAIKAGILIIKKLDEPQKPVIQQFVADLVDWTNKMQCAPSDVIRDLHDNGDLANLPRDLELDKLSEYFEKAYCRYDFEKACFVGYEVEKEPLYYVYFPEIIASPEIFFPDIEGAYLMKSDDGIELADNNDFDDMKFTEQEIKAIDKRYWAFAVPLEEVAEG
ncbi:Uncharacterised protein [Enterococcus hirae]|uniref:DUF1642 domain-containing protein n=1 Tax=Enterococcus hirae TaxID=1354 RepID=UPI00195C46F8|nr:DUF1642 domain-containing protein [Enterococcus hirae]VTX88057.1 Uncharacterised protein [Enterococcus hirae]